MLPPALPNLDFPISVNAQNQARQFTACGMRGGDAGSGVVRLLPGDLAGLGPCCPQVVQDGRDGDFILPLLL
ncbi:hypothetical protein [Streptomyces cadmiisoli]|uniref:hypothetical protein n=1 Tax=Streptomyces cadmiisoli TaxID=2184053 RepID=UPI00365F86F6